jgi:hypothetical protein
MRPTRSTAATGAMSFTAGRATTRSMEATTTTPSAAPRPIASARGGTGDRHQPGSRRRLASPRDGAASRRAQRLGVLALEHRQSARAHHRALGGEAPPSGRTRRVRVVGARDGLPGGQSPDRREAGRHRHPRAAATESKPNGDESPRCGIHVDAGKPSRACHPIRTPSCCAVRPRCGASAGGRAVGLGSRRRPCLRRRLPPRRPAWPARLSRKRGTLLPKTVRGAETRPSGKQRASRPLVA